MNHIKKKKLARRLRTQNEIKKRVPIFQTVNWEKRKEARKNKLDNKIKINNL